MGVGAEREGRKETRSRGLPPLATPLPRLASPSGDTMWRSGRGERAAPRYGAMRLIRNPTQPARRARPRGTRSLLRRKFPPLNPSGIAAHACSLSKSSRSGMATATQRFGMDCRSSLPSAAPTRVRTSGPSPSFKGGQFSPAAFRGLPGCSYRETATP